MKRKRTEWECSQTSCPDSPSQTSQQSQEPKILTDEECRARVDLDHIIGSIPMDFFCPICQHMMYNPVQTSCGHLYCSSCYSLMEGTAASYLECSVCRTKVENSFHDMNLERVIRNQRVKCPNHNECDWQGTVLQLNTHFSACEYEKIQCPNSCGVPKATRKEITAHLDSCPKGYVKCATCNREVLCRSQGLHKAICPKALIRCPNNCEDMVLREELSAHKAACPQRLVICDICGTSIPCSEMEEHLQNTTLHIQILRTRCETLRHQVDELTKSREALIKEKLRPTDKSSFIATFYPNTKALGSDYHAFFIFKKYPMRCSLYVERSKDSFRLNLRNEKTDDYTLLWPFSATYSITLMNQALDTNHVLVAQVDTDAAPLAWKEPPNHGTDGNLLYNIALRPNYWQNNTLIFKIQLSLNKPWLYD